MLGQTAALLRINPGPSPRLLALVLPSHFLALGVIPFLPAAILLQTVMAVAVVLSLIHSLRIHVWRNSPYAITMAEWDADGQWTLYFPHGRTSLARLRRSSYVQPWLMVLNFSLADGGRRSFVLVPDALDPDLLRRLRVRLRLTQDPIKPEADAKVRLSG